VEGRTLGNITLGGDTILLRKQLFSWVVVSAKLMRDSPENSPAIFICGGELRLMSYCWRTPDVVSKALYRNKYTCILYTE
jgi:hypothetical protein